MTTSIHFTQLKMFVGNTFIFEVNSMLISRKSFIYFFCLVNRIIFFSATIFVSCPPDEVSKNPCKNHSKKNGVRNVKGTWKCKNYKQIKKLVQHCVWIKSRLKTDTPGKHMVQIKFRHRDNNKLKAKKFKAAK